MIPIFRAKVESGKLTGFTEKYQSYLKTLEGKFVEVKVQKERNQRSLNQNNYYWGIVIELLSQHTGYTPDETHEICRYQFLKKVNDGGFEFIQSTTKLSTTEFELYLEEVKRWAAFLGLVIPNPNEGTA